MSTSKFMRKVTSYLGKAFLYFGIIVFVLLLGGFISDLRNFDRTKGGYEAPYEDYTGEPINFDELDQSNEGMIGRGYVMNIGLNCTTGMISFEIFKQKVDYRVVSERAIKVHQPREACIKRGFEPEF
ncbi:hypothetical protein KGF86_12720 [Ornithinibacillus massiliensis]|nr:hypothetical protein [Ornithinibacillus massiliensis]MBS3681069.1 hypothetical protein [Ornithinibacillus massiliensis]